MATIGVRARGNVAAGATVQSGGQQTLADATTNAAAANASTPRFFGWVDFSQPATWAMLYFVGALLFLAFMYFGHGGSRGSVF